MNVKVTRRSRVRRDAAEQGLPPIIPPLPSRARQMPQDAPRVEGAGRQPSASPLYLQVKDHLIHRVLTGEWGPGELLPSEMRLADEYGLSQGTVRKAIEEMAVECLVTRHPGRGTFVTSHKGDYKPFRFQRLYYDDGERLKTEDTSYSSWRRTRAGEGAASALQLAPGDEVAEIVRVRRCEGRAVAADYTYISQQLCPDADTVLGQQQPASIYLSLDQIYNLLIVRVEEQLRARTITANEADLLEVPLDTPILEIERTAYALGGQPVEWRIAVCNTDGLHYWNSTD